jgi:hypothetical protein
METAIAKAVRAFRKEMAQNNSTFFLLYSDIRLQSNKVTVKLTTNSTVEGVSSILGTVLEPTEQAQALLEHVFAGIAASPDASSTERVQSARATLEQLSKLFTVKNIEPPTKPTSAIQS